MGRASDQSTTGAGTGPGASFATTHWSLVFAAGHGGSAVAREAMAELCRLYWYPLYVFARRQGTDVPDAQDLTQGFFEHLLAHELVAGADAARGRFRTYLLRCFQNFQASQHARSTREKRGGGQALLSLDLAGMEQRLSREWVEREDPRRLYERQWALAVIEEARRRLREECAAQGRERILELLEPRLAGGREGQSAAELARELGTTEGTVNVMVHRLRRRYREVLREVVFRTVDSPTEVEEELRHLLRVLREP